MPAPDSILDRAIEVACDTADHFSGSDPRKVISARQRGVEGQDCGQRRRLVSRAWVDLACRRAGHQADPLSTGRPGDLPTCCSRSHVGAEVCPRWVEHARVAVAVAPCSSYTRGRVRRTAVIALVLLVLAPAGVRAATWYRSDGDGELRAKCCCPVHPGQRGRPVPNSELRTACCCTLIAVPAREAADRNAPPLDAGVVPVAVAVVTAVLPPASAAVAAIDRPRTTRGPPGLSDLFVRHCALLL